MRWMERNQDTHEFHYGRSIFFITYVDFSMYEIIHKLQYIDVMEKIAPPNDAE